MKVYAFVKIKHHSDPNSSGAQYGDICSFHRVETPRSKAELKFFLPVLVDINIPCSDKYDRGNDCVKCEYNDPEVCDVRKYIRCLFSAGDILDPPEILYKRRYNIDLGSLLSSMKTNESNLILKEEKTEKDVTSILAISTAKEQVATILQDKVK